MLYNCKYRVWLRHHETLALWACGAASHDRVSSIRFPAGGKLLLLSAYPRMNPETGMSGSKSGFSRYCCFASLIFLAVSSSVLRKTVFMSPVKITFGTAFAYGVSSALSYFVLAGIGANLL